MSIITPPPYGRPDYSAPLSSLDGAVTTWDVALPAHSTKTVASVSVAGYKHVGMFLYTSSTAQVIDFSWSVTGNYGAEPQYDDYMSIPSGVFTSWFFVAAKGPLLTLSVTDTSGAANVTRGICWPSNRERFNPVSDVVQKWVSSGGNALAPGWNYVPFNVVSGSAAVVSVQTTGTFDVELDYLDNSGLWEFAWTNGGFAANQSMSQFVALSSGYYRVGVNNTTAVDQGGMMGVTQVVNTSG